MGKGARGLNTSGKQAEKGGKTRPEKTPGAPACICANAHCRLRKAGCRGFDACPGYKGKG